MVSSNESVLDVLYVIILKGKKGPFYDYSKIDLKWQKWK